jgi:transcriptional regulator with XRE-family HTH domain
MDRKYKNYIKQWRLKRGYTQKVLANRMAMLVGDHPPEDAALKIPTTEASLSRIESGRQNFHMATLEALAECLEVDDPGHLISRNPLKEGRVISMVERLNEAQAAQVEAVIIAMFGTTVNGR